jgi:TolB-like protein
MALLNNPEGDMITTFTFNRQGLIMYKKILGIILAGALLFLSGCSGSGSKVKSFMRENASLGHIQMVAVLPFEGGGSAPRIREFAMTQLLASGLFDVADKGRVDNLLQEEGIAEGAPLDAATIRRLSQRLKVQAVLFGSVQQESETRGNAVFAQTTMTLRLIDSETGTLLWQASGRGSGYSLADRLFGMAPKDSFVVTMDLLRDLFKTLH